jgi:hypothetical protein
MTTSTNVAQWNAIAPVVLNGVNGGRLGERFGAKIGSYPIPPLKLS